MDINIRWTSGRTYAVATIENGGTSIELGYLNASERAALAATLRETADELVPDGTRDELLETLRELVTLEADGMHASEASIEPWERARAVVAKARGE